MYYEVSDAYFYYGEANIDFTMVDRLRRLITHLIITESLAGE
jgi:hypothetical protein